MGYLKTGLLTFRSICKIFPSNLIRSNKTGRTYHRLLFCTVFFIISKYSLPKALARYLFASLIPFITRFFRRALSKKSLFNCACHSLSSLATKQVCSFLLKSSHVHELTEG